MTFKKHHSYVKTLTINIKIKRIVFLQYNASNEAQQGSWARAISYDIVLESYYYFPVPGQL